jgi:hypothetical protein
MPKRSSKPPRGDELAKLVAAVATGATVLPKTEQGKDAGAVALGRKGGLKGGKARAAALTKKQRTEIARKGAAARWKR